MSDATVGSEMSRSVLTIEPGRTLREAAHAMTKAKIGAVVVIDPDQPGPGIVTERDISRAVGDGLDPADERVVDHTSTNASYATPEWPLDEAVKAMRDGGFRHLVVIDGTDLVGIVSMRDVVRRWSRDRSATPRQGGTS